MSDTTGGAGITVGRIYAICPMMCYFVKVRQQTRERREREMVAVRCMILEFKW